MVRGGITDSIADAIEEFLTGVRHAQDLDRVLATLLVTDIVDSTSRAAELGDAAWKEVLAAHHEPAGEEIRIAVHIGARVAAFASPGEVLVSRTVKDLVAGSALTFEDRGIHELKGVPDR